ncbi:MAG: hypothetical protein LBU90_03685 [Bacteroidales bacterium]|jgi:hypothetical protein|nr:hypothetical protein [Bacteroidales bacterium]
MKAPLVHEVVNVNEGGTTWYFGFPKNTDATKCRIERVKKIVFSNTRSVTYRTEWVGFGMFDFDWAQREQYEYALKTV